MVDYYADPETIPMLSDAQWSRLTQHATRSDVAAGEQIVATGRENYPMILVESGELELVRDSLWWLDEEVLALIGPGHFAGELGLLNGQRAFLSVRAKAPSRIWRLEAAALRQALSEDDELGDLILHSLWARRESLRKGSAALTLKFVGVGDSREFLALQRFAERLDLIHTALALELEPDATISHPGFEWEAEDLPVAFIQGEAFVRATPAVVAEQLGLSYEPTSEGAVDLVVIGGGPAGLAAAIYGASEGLSTLLLEAVAPGGQAGATSRIENFLGFPFGVSGASLIGQATLQAIKFGVRVFAPCAASGLRSTGDGLEVVLTDGKVIRARSAVVTSGAAYKRLHLDRWDFFERTSIYYAATALELRQVHGAPVVVAGGGNSAGQAALYLASNGCDVHLVVRGGDLGERMSSYLVDRIVDDPRIHLHPSSNIVGLDGEHTLEAVHIDTAGTVEARGLFCFIGADPATGWIGGLDCDEAGFIRTGTDISQQTLQRWQDLGREPLPFETSTPRVFAAGDVRRGSMKRVAAAVGEGSSAIASVHRVLA
ncbi:FAD-dependent oxidoreductase [Mycetocola zhujimingii]|nr:FAD-dependent oxidoreductase [Mycetocola zhujimingii]